jgi:ABC-type amino acid transport system permease subunit
VTVPPDSEDVPRPEPADTGHREPQDVERPEPDVGAGVMSRVGLEPPDDQPTDTGIAHGNGGTTRHAGMVALGVVLSAFSSEVWVGALNSIQKGQREAASALGLSKAQAFRLVVFPQLIRVALPGLGNNWMVLLKETSLISVITLQDIMFIATRANVVTKEPFLFFGTAMLLYFFFSLVSAWGIDRLEQRTQRGQAAFGGATR